jgi:hypothetical protein
LETGDEVLGEEDRRSWISERPEAPVAEAARDDDGVGV